MADEDRDRLAEAWLKARHTEAWYIGDASDTEWDAAYRAADEALGFDGNSEVTDGP